MTVGARQSRRRRRGFTLVESMATIVVLGVLGSTASYLILDSVDDYTDATTTAQLHAEMSIALDRAMRELRKMELDGAATGVAPNLTSMTTIWLTWEDAAANAYQLGKVGSDLQLEVAGSGLSTLLTNVTSLNISIFDEDNTDISPCTGAGCDPVRRVRFDVTTQRNGVSETLRFKVFIRSTMSGAYGTQPMHVTRRAFTLIELLAVVLILAILAGVALPKFLDLQDRAKESSCKGSLSGVRAGVANYYANEAIVNGTATYPTLAQLTTIGTVMQERIPENPYAGTTPDVVTTAVKADSDGRNLVGGTGIGGWAYFDGTGGFPAVFYANSNVVNENSF